jgi:hypothetical protein
MIKQRFHIFIVFSPGTPSPLMGEGEGGGGHAKFGSPLSFILSPAFVPQGGASRRQAPGERSLFLIF